jgi:hypothetical protein
MRYKGLGHDFEFNDTGVKWRDGWPKRFG